MRTERSRVVEISLAECGPAAATAPVRKRDFEAERLKHFDGGDPDVRLVITHERVVPENHATAPSNRPLVFWKPVIEPPVRIRRQRAFRRNAERLLHQLAQRRELE